MESKSYDYLPDFTTGAVVHIDRIEDTTPLVETLTTGVLTHLLDARMACSLISDSDPPRHHQISWPSASFAKTPTQIKGPGLALGFRRFACAAF